jgi:glycosyltransferase involved in cell wall biosynthesis
MLRGQDGNQRKELDKLLGWLTKQPAPDVVCLPNSMLIGLAKPLREALGRPVCCTLQGEDLFLESLGEPWRGQALELIRAAVPHVDAFLAVSEYYTQFMRGYLRIPENKIHTVPLGISLKGMDPGYRIRSNCFTVGYFARVAPKRAARFVRPTGVCATSTEFSRRLAGISCARASQTTCTTLAQA